MKRGRDLKEKLMTLVTAVAVMAAMLHTLLPHHAHDGTVVTLLYTFSSPAGDIQERCPAAGIHDHHHDGDSDQDCGDSQGCGTGVVSRASFMQHHIEWLKMAMTAAVAAFINMEPAATDCAGDDEGWRPEVPRLLAGHEPGTGQMRAPPCF